MTGWPPVPPRSVSAPAISTSDDGADTLADSLSDVRAKVNKSLPAFRV